MTKYQRNTPGKGFPILMAVLFSLALIIAATPATAGSVSTSSELSVQSSFIPPWGPYLTATNANSTIINLKTESPSTAVVHYASEAYYNANNSFNMTATDNFSGSLHHIQLSGLEAGTTYYYQVNCNGAVTGTFHFSTFPAAGKFTFIVYGDTQDELPNFSQAERHKLIADQIAREENILFVVNTGDLINDGNDNGNWDRYFDATRAMGAGTAVFPVHGNHDGDTIFYDIFGLKPYYSFDCANAHFTVLDTIDSSPDQTNWLKTDLANDKDWKFVSFHYPLYTSDPKHFGGWENFKKEWENIFINNQVDAIWNGHIHAYERYLENGIMYIVAGTGGGPYGLLNTNKYAGYQNSLERSLGYAKVTINPAAGTALVEIIRVADISLDGKEVTQLPQRTIYETFRLTSPTAVLPAAFTNGVKTTINAGDLPHRTLLNGARHSDDNLMDLTGVLFRMLADQFNVDSNFFKILFHPK